MIVSGPSTFLPGRTPHRYLADPRTTPAWRRARKAVLARDHSTCRACGRPASDVDHIIELIDGGAPYDLGNLQALCAPCHDAKSSEARYQRASRATSSWGRMALCPWCSGSGLCATCAEPSHPCPGCLGVRLVPERSAVGAEIPSQSVLAEVSSVAWAGARPAEG
ncbi:MAG: HNH endonuclease [Thermoplasmata archaeon]|nr:HNH endonuclease [Thermoplasmata archaeon]